MYGSCEPGLVPHAVDRVAHQYVSAGLATCSESALASTHTPWLEACVLSGKLRLGLLKHLATKIQGDHLPWISVLALR
jgi:hypothetical protein